MASTSDFKRGLCLVMNHDLLTIVEFQHVKPGKGPAFVRTKLKSVNSGKVIDHTFTAGVKVETARIETHEYQYLYKDDLGFHFMNNEDYNQISLEENKINAPKLLKDGQIVSIVFHAEKDMVLYCELPSFVELKVAYTEPGIKGDTATNATKPATLETGATIQVPLFIDDDELIQVDTRTGGSYSERVR